MVIHFLFISVDYVAEYTSYGVFFQEEHFFRGFGKGEYLCHASGIFSGDIFDGIYDRLDADVVPDTFRLEIFPEFLLEEWRGASAGHEDIFQEELLGDIGSGDKQSIEEDGEK